MAGESKRPDEIIASGYYWVRRKPDLGGEIVIMQFDIDDTFQCSDGSRGGGWDSMGREDGGDWEISEVLRRVMPLAGSR